MKEIDKCYQVLRVKQFDNFRKIRKSYNNLMLKYHPSRPLGRFHRDSFRDIVLAFDLLSKLNSYSSDFSKTDEEIYKEWVDLDMPFALEKIDQYSRMNFREFEKEFLPGCFKPMKAIIYLIFLIVAVFAVAYPISAHRNGEIPTIFLLYLSIGFTIPLLILVYKTIIDEKFITRRFWDRFRMRLYLYRVQRRKNSFFPTEYQDNESNSNNIFIPSNLTDTPTTKPDHNGK